MKPTRETYRERVCEEKEGEEEKLKEHSMTQILIKMLQNKLTSMTKHKQTEELAAAAITIKTTALTKKNCK